MSIVAIYVAYLVISFGLTFAAGRALSRNGRMFLLDLPAGVGTAEGISNMLVAATSLLALGFIVLTMRTTSDVATTRLAIQLLAGKLGEVLLVLGALYLANIAILTRLRRRLRPQPHATWRPTPRRVHR